MSIILKDGTVLPDLPEEDLSAYPYCFILISPSVYGDDGPTALIFSRHPIIYAPVNMLGETPFLVTNEYGYKSYVYAPQWEITQWELMQEFDSAYFTTTFDETAGDEVLWSNHDILIAASADQEVGMSSVVIGTEIYFPNSLTKPPFVLPDGTELPALPDGCFDGTPYGAIVGIDWMGTGELSYSLQTMSKPILALPVALMPEDSGITPSEGVTHHIALPPCTAKAAGLDGDAWTAMEQEDITEFAVSFGVGVILWANYDLCEVTELSEDLAYKVGSTVVRKSDVNYRITDGWMKSIANEARRLGSVTGSMKPDVVESTLRATTTGGDFSEATLISNGALLSGVKAYGKDGVLYTGSIETKTSSDITFDGTKVVVPAGYYATECEQNGGCEAYKVRNLITSINRYNADIELPFSHMGKSISGHILFGNMDDGNAYIFIFDNYNSEEHANGNSDYDYSIMVVNNGEEFYLDNSHVDTNFTSSDITDSNILRIYIPDIGIFSSITSCSGVLYCE